MVMDESVAIRQDIRPLHIGLLNLMPNKIATETQIARLIGATPLQIELSLVRIGSHQARNTPQEHLIDFYHTWEEVRHRKFDGFIITGAPIETLPYEEVTYWRELREIFDWTTTHVHSPFFICWGAMAAIYHFHGVPKHLLKKKAFGVYRHRNLNPASPYLAGFSDDFSITVSRWTEVLRSDLKPEMNLEVLMESDETGLCMVAEKKGNRLYVFNHVEYDSTTLADEYNPRREGGHTDRNPGELFSRQRSFPPAAEPLAQPRIPAVRQLDQPGLPDDAVRDGGYRHRATIRARRFRQARPPLARFLHPVR